MLVNEQIPSKLVMILTEVGTFGNGEGKTNDEGMDHDPQLENQDAHHLSFSTYPRLLLTVLVFFSVHLALFNLRRFWNLCKTGSSRRSAFRLGRSSLPTLMRRRTHRNTQTLTPVLVVDNVVFSVLEVILQVLNHVEIFCTSRVPWRVAYKCREKVRIA